MVAGVLCSAFYERLKDVRDYHRRYPYLEVSEARPCPVPATLAAPWVLPLEPQEEQSR